jgi:hypothetical protein
MSSYPVKPQDITKTFKIARFEIMSVNVELFCSATINVCLYDIHNVMFQSVVVNMSNDQYKNWMNNDEFLVKYVACCLGLELDQ